MKEYEPPKTNPSNQIVVVGVKNMEVNEAVYFSAKMQNRIRWTLVVVGAVFIGWFLATSILMAFVCGFVVGVLLYFVLSKLMPLADLTSTTKYKKFGAELTMGKVRAKLGLPSPEVSLEKKNSEPSADDSE